MDELTLQKAVNIVEVFIVWGEKREGFDEALRMVCEYADNMGSFTGDKTRKEFKAEIEAKIQNEYFKGKKEGIQKVEEEIFKNWFYEIRNKDVRIDQVSEIVFKDDRGNEIQFEPVRKGYWETPEPDYDRDGFRLPVRVAICSECQKSSKLPTTMFCPNCGSWNKNNGLGDE